MILTTLDCAHVGRCSDGWRQRGPRGWIKIRGKFNGKDAGSLDLLKESCSVGLIFDEDMAWRVKQEQGTGTLNEVREGHPIVEDVEQVASVVTGGAPDGADTEVCRLADLVGDVPAMDDHLQDGG